MPVIAGPSDYGAVTPFIASLLSITDMFSLSGGDFGLYHLFHPLQTADSLVATGVSYE